MDFRFGEREEKLRGQIREFVKQNLPPHHNLAMFEEEHFDDHWHFAMAVSKKLAQKGWLTMAWPKEYGGFGGSATEQVVYAEEVGYWGIPGFRMGVSGVDWVGPSLMLFGTEAQKKKYLPPIAAGDSDGIWCTGYSEPDAGSDFANIQTRAERKGDEYLINGQKVWTSAAHRARWCWLAARTDPNASKKHHGISIIIVDMKSEGITVRPLVNYVGIHLLNEVFFKDVWVPVENLVGRENKGWSQLMQALAFERSGAAGAVGTARRILDELVHYAKANGLMAQSQVRLQLAALAVDIEALRVLAYEAVWKATTGMRVIYEPSRDKAFHDELRERLTRVGTQILGAYSQLDPMHKDTRWTRIRGAVEHLYWLSPGLASAGGSTFTQRNIVGQFGLQLPKSY